MAESTKALVSLTFLVLLILFAYLQTQAPAARADSELDYAALTSHVAMIAARPHPMGSVANRQVRDYIVDYFRSLGLATEIQKTTVVYRHPLHPQTRTVIGNVENIIARLPGNAKEPRQSLKDLVLMSHYDSRADGPGAGDDASGTAAIMETARIMASTSAPLHDVIFLITDGEEMGLLGAQGFFRQHKAAKNVGLVLDFEARGSNGASSMFETSEGNAWLVENLLESAPDLLASSLSYEIYKRMPNDTDMTISKGEGIAGLNFAFLSGLYDYHTMGDSPKNLHPDTLAHQANYVLATARHFANLGEWQTSTHNKTYFNLWNGVLVSYSERMAVVTGIAVLLMGLWVFAAAMRTKKMSWGSLALGGVALLVLLLLVSNVFESLIDYQLQADAGIEHMVSLGEWPFFAFLVLTLGITAWYGHVLGRGMSRIEAIAPIVLVALVSLLSSRGWVVVLILILIALPLQWLLRSRTSRPSLWVAGLVSWWLVTALIVYAAPNASYLFIWPLFSVLAGIILYDRVASTVRHRFFINLGAAVIPLLLLIPVLILGYLALGTKLPSLIMILSMLMFLLVWPVLGAIGKPANGMPALIILVVGLLLTAEVVFERNFDIRHKRGEAVFFALDIDQQQAFWVSPDVRSGSWLETFMGAAEEDNLQRLLPGFDADVLIRNTSIPDYAAATLEVLDDRMVDGQRQLRLHLQSPVKANYINLLFAKKVQIFSATVNGFPLKTPLALAEINPELTKADSMKEKDRGLSQQWWRWRWYGLPAEGADVVLMLEPGKALPVKIVEVDYRTPQGMPARPENSMRRPYFWSDATVIFQTLVLEK